MTKIEKANILKKAYKNLADAYATLSKLSEDDGYNYWILSKRFRLMESWAESYIEELEEG